MVMNLKAQLYICTLADTGSYSKASELLYISQPTLSMFVKSLEKTLGMPLFTREGKRLVPTYIGKKYVDAGRKMLLLEKEFEEEFDRVKAGNSGLLRIGTNLRISPYILPSALSAFMKKYPEMEVKVIEDTYSVLISKFKNREIDIMINHQKELFDDFTYVHLMKDHLLLALPPNHPANGAACYKEGYAYPYLDLKLVENERFILQYEDQTIRRFADHAILYSGVCPKTVLNISSIEAGVQMAAEGLGVAFCLESHIQTIRFQKPINFFLVGDTENFALFSAAYRKDMELTPYFKYFLHLIQQKFQIAEID